MAPGPVEVLLWDCDGVLQHTRRDWAVVLDEVGGEGFAQRVFVAELPALRGERSLRACLEEALDETERATGRRPVAIEDLLGMWEQVDIDGDAVDVLAEVRGSGVRCYLATNQQDLGSAH